MACFLVPMGESVIMSIVQRIVEKREKKSGKLNTEKNKLSMSSKISWLNKLLWGGTALLAIEHIWHGEVVPWFPFLTAMESPEETSAMLNEISTNGIFMAIAVTIVWVIMVIISDKMEKVRDISVEKSKSSV
ncbi:MAG: hypothetical protein COX48_04415 [bacterium (Candidatus Stahlbacteria) CG23_combo_of_CG06-09_8_20_14_all_34_7]|nr:MAG: hypothetical protein COX48_04415 [bacterium (Candidatus Stahlbacteria) CG23_combo_of_CG06-09_8_20_14_all_34_7]